MGKLDSQNNMLQQAVIITFPFNPTWGGGPNRPAASNILM